ncbi:MAG: hypothetical protein GTO08_00740, partial [Deltaproteobacteria bacterium]|nr:hypothetical protein [Deltaproteobacteria bacterium]
TVAGTTIVAVDETGSIVATDNTAGKTPDSSGNYPFSLTCPTGHQYRIYFIVAEGTSSEHVVSLYDSSDAGNVFSLSQEGTLDLGFVDTSGQNAHATNDPLDLAGVTVAGEIPIFQYTQTTLANKSFASIDDAAGEYTINTFDISNVFTETEGSLLGVTVSSGTWSFNSSGTLTIDFPPSDS